MERGIEQNSRRTNNGKMIKHIILDGLLNNGTVVDRSEGALLSPSTRENSTRYIFKCNKERKGN